MTYPEEMTMTYRTEYTDGRTSDTYATREEATAAIKAAMGWDAVVLSSSYTVDGPRGAADGDVETAWSAYETDEELVADQDGAKAPRIVTVDHTTR